MNEPLLHGLHRLAGGIGIDESARQLQNLALTKLRRMLEEPEAIEVAA